MEAYLVGHFFSVTWHPLLCKSFLEGYTASLRFNYPPLSFRYCAFVHLQYTTILTKGLVTSVTTTSA